MKRSHAPSSAGTAAKSWVFCSLCISLLTGDVVWGFKQSGNLDPNVFADPPRACRQQAWLTFNLSRATAESLTRQIERWAQRDLTGGFYLGLGGGNTRDLS